MTYTEAKVYLENLSRYGSVLGLDSMTHLCEELGNPQGGVSCIHVAGTNGKGSVVAYLSCILKEAGYKVGTYTSPVVFSCLEQYQINNTWCQEETFAALVLEVSKAIESMEAKGLKSPTKFEVETALFFLYCKQQQCDYIVLETGMGGRTDATNVVQNTKVAVFTPIGMDHVKELGPKLKDIARVKAGIIKPGCVVVSSPQVKEVKEILIQEAKEKGCPIHFLEKEKIWVKHKAELLSEFSYFGYGDLKVSMYGTHQIENACVAVQVVAMLGNISAEALRMGLGKTSIPGRLDLLCKDPVVFVDGAHNVPAIKELIKNIKHIKYKRLIVVNGMFTDKDSKEITRLCCSKVDSVYTVPLPNATRSFRAEELAYLWRKSLLISCQVEACISIKEGLTKALQEANKYNRKRINTIIIVFGSLSLIRETYLFFKERNQDGC